MFVAYNITSKPEITQRLENKLERLNKAIATTPRPNPKPVTRQEWSKFFEKVELKRDELKAFKKDFEDVLDMLPGIFCFATEVHLVDSRTFAKVQAKLHSDDFRIEHDLFCKIGLEYRASGNKTMDMIYYVYVPAVDTRLQ